MKNDFVLVTIYIANTDQKLTKKKRDERNADHDANFAEKLLEKCAASLKKNQ